MTIKTAQASPLRFWTWLIKQDYALNGASKLDWNDSVSRYFYEFSVIASSPHLVPLRDRYK